MKRIPTVIVIIILVIVTLLFLALNFMPLPTSVQDAEDAKLPIISTLPDQINYKSVESTGIFGHAEYYIFDSNGIRYKVSQKTFDSLTDIPRK